MSYIEIDCPWFDPEWLADHPDFPLAATVAVSDEETKEEAA